MPTIEQVCPVDLVELGDRAACGLYGENTGLVWGQRHTTIVQRRPAGFTWRVHYGPDGMASKLTWPAWDGKGLW